MLRLSTPAHARRWSDEMHLARDRIAFVPTMGALHDGHASLMAIGHELASKVAVSIFVNPLQFDRAEDFSHYPRTLEEDLEICESLGVDAVYVPEASALYPEGFDTTIRPGDLATRFEGASRPGHFDGVATVVVKLFQALRPDVAVFGRKDYQQLAIIRQVTRDLDLGIEIVAGPTVREGDGLALSSRNRRLTVPDREHALVIPRALEAVHHAVAEGHRRVEDVLAPARRLLAERPEVRVEYLEVADARTLEPMTTIDRPAVVLIAAFVGAVRLIDNLELEPVDGPGRSD